MSDQQAPGEENLKSEARDSKAPLLTMRRGAIGMIDALGFKGIWGDPDHPNLDALVTLRAVEQAANQQSKEWLKLLQGDFPDDFKAETVGPAVEVRMLSDTLVVAASFEDGVHNEPTALKSDGLSPKERRDRIDAFLLLVVTYCLGHSVVEAALAEPPLVFRGAVSVGRFLLEETRLIGPAVDQAAEYGTLPDGAFVWLTPASNSLLTRMKFMLKHEEWEGQLLWYAVPLRDGRELRSWVVDPLFFCKSDEDRKRARTKILAAMRPQSVDVAIKRQNTNRFLGRIQDDYKLKQSIEARRKAKEVAQREANPVADSPVGESTTSDKPVDGRG